MLTTAKQVLQSFLLIWFTVIRCWNMLERPDIVMNEKTWHCDFFRDYKKTNNSRHRENAYDLPTMFVTLWHQVLYKVWSSIAVSKYVSDEIAAKWLLTSITNNSLLYVQNLFSNLSNRLLSIKSKAWHCKHHWSLLDKQTLVTTEKITLKSCTVQKPRIWMVFLFGSLVLHCYLW